MKCRAFMLAAFAALATAAICEAQTPRLRRADGTLRRPTDREIRNLIMYGSFPNHRTVCPDNCDFTTIQDALSYIATQTHDAYNQWTVGIYRGNSTVADPYVYDLGATVVPSWVTLVGHPAMNPPGTGIVTPLPIVNLTAATGTQIEFQEGAGALHLTFLSLVTLTGNTVMVKTSGQGGGINYFEGVQFNGNVNTSGSAFAYDILGLDSFQTNLVECSAQRNGSGSNASVRNLVTTANNVAVNVFGGRYWPQSGQAKAVEGVAGQLNLNWTRVVAGATTALTITGGTSTVRYSDVPTYSGTITWLSPPPVASAASPPYACDAAHAGQLYVDSTTPSLCFCSGSAWTTTVAAGDCT